MRIGHPDLQCLTLTHSQAFVVNDTDSLFCFAEYDADSATCSAVYDEEMLVVQLQNELAKLEVDILHTQSHNLRLEQTLKLLDQDMNEKMQTISKYEVRFCSEPPTWKM